MYKRKIIMGLLALGTVGGFAAGFKSMSCHAKNRRQHWEERAAEVCVKAAKKAEAEERSARRGAPDEQ